MPHCHSAKAIRPALAVVSKHLQMFNSLTYPACELLCNHHMHNAHPGVVSCQVPSKRDQRRRARLAPSIFCGQPAGRRCSPYHHHFPSVRLTTRSKRAAEATAPPRKKAATRTTRTATRRALNAAGPIGNWAYAECTTQQADRAAAGNNSLDDHL